MVCHLSLWFTCESFLWGKKNSIDVCPLVVDPRGVTPTHFVAHIVFISSKPKKSVCSIKQVWGRTTKSQPKKL